MSERQAVPITPEVSSEINRIVGADYDYATLMENVGECFSMIDLDVPACQECAIQLACGVLLGERKYHILGVRERYATGKEDPAPPGLIAELKDFAERRAAPPPPPPPPAERPVVAAVAPPLTLVPPPQVLPFTPPAPPPASPVLPVSAPSPESIMAASVPSNGAPPTGWPNLERDDLAQLALQVGYSEDDVWKKRSKKLIELITAKKPAWGVPEELREEAPAAVAPPPSVPMTVMPVVMPPVTETHSGNGSAVVALPSQSTHPPAESIIQTVRGSMPDLRYVSSLELTGPAGELSKWMTETIAAGRKISIVVHFGD
jgi:hypothetical protein